VEYYTTRVQLLSTYSHVCARKHTHTHTHTHTHRFLFIFSIPAIWNSHKKYSSKNDGRGKYSPQKSHQKTSSVTLGTPVTSQSCLSFLYCGREELTLLLNTSSWGLAPVHWVVLVAWALPLLSYYVSWTLTPGLEYK
jgi:hypothetical protein